MKKMQIGVIGGGMIGAAHMANFDRDRRCELRWLADVARQSLSAAERFHVRHTTDDYRDMLGDDALDAVVVATPPDSHCKIGLDVMRAGKDLIMEKPLASTLREARRLVRESQKHEHLMITGCSCRHARVNPKFRFVKSFVESGKLGRVYHVHHRRVGRQGRGGIEYHPAAKWFLDRDRAGGGPLFDWGVYDLSFHLGVLGQPKFLKAQAFCINGLDRVDPGTPNFTVEEHGGAMMAFEGGLTYYWERASNAHMHVPNETVLYGTSGGLRFGYLSNDPDEVEFSYVDRGGRGKARTRKLKINQARHRNDMIELGKVLVSALLRKIPAPMPLDIELANLEIVTKVYKAANW